MAHFVHDAKHKNICVYCGASPGKDAAYMEAAAALGEELVRRGLGLVYGGGNVGLMGQVSSTVSKGGGQVLGVIPRALHPREVSGETDGGIETVVVESMHERKARMADAADAFVGLPGGFGTLEELMEMITWQQLGFSKKPVGLLNINGYYDRLLAFFDHSVEEGFIRSESRAIVISAATPGELLDKLQAHIPPEDLISLATRGALDENQRG